MLNGGRALAYCVCEAPSSTEKGNEGRKWKRQMCFHQLSGREQSFALSCLRKRIKLFLYKERASTQSQGSTEMWAARSRESPWPGTGKILLCLLIRLNLELLNSVITRWGSQGSSHCCSHKSQVWGSVERDRLFSVQGDIPREQKSSRTHFYLTLLKPTLLPQ